MTTVPLEKLRKLDAPSRCSFVDCKYEEAVTGFGPAQVESRDVIFNEGGLPRPTLN